MRTHCGARLPDSGDCSRVPTRRRSLDGNRATDSSDDDSRRTNPSVNTSDESGLGSQIKLSFIILFGLPLRCHPFWYQNKSPLMTSIDSFDT